MIITMFVYSLCARVRQRTFSHFRVKQLRNAALLFTLGPGVADTPGV